MGNLDDNLRAAADDPEQLGRLLEVELQQNRARWKRSAEQRRTYRGAALLFLVVIFAAVIAIYFFARSDMLPRQQRHDSKTSTNR